MIRQQCTLKPLRDYIFKRDNKIVGAIARSKSNAKKRLYACFRNRFKYGKVIDAYLELKLVFIEDKEFERTDFHGKETPRNKYYKRRT